MFLHVCKGKMRPVTGHIGQRGSAVGRDGDLRGEQLASAQGFDHVVIRKLRCTR
jgi:hypothetical protein